MACPARARRAPRRCAARSAPGWRAAAPPSSRCPSARCPGRGSSSTCPACAAAPSQAEAPPHAGTRLAAGREVHHARREEVEEHADDDEVAEEDEGPAHIVADHLTLVAHEAARRDADARGLRSNRLDE